MSKKQTEILEKVYNATSVEESEGAYDEWANGYEADVFSYGSRFPWVTAAVFTRFIKPGEGPILDAGCGTGLQIEPIFLAGYEPIIGIDLSSGMLDVARTKGMYSELRQMTLGERLDFDDGAFANTLTVGTITPGHAPPHSYEELIRVTCRGGKVVVNLRSDDDVDPAYPAALAQYEKEGRWKSIFKSKPYVCMPTAEPDVLTTAHVFEVL